MTVRHGRDAFRPDLEGLRGLAVLLVVGCHCGISWCAGGFVGVDVFFVLSGYLITGLLAAEYRLTSRIDLPGFFARRARRLLPECLLVLLATMVAACTLLAPQEIASTGRAAAAAGFYASNLFFDHTAADYFAPHVEENPLLHTWSLGVEEQFYLVWPLLLLLVNRGPHRIVRSILILSALCALSFICSLYSTAAVPTFAFYELPARGWEFAAGGLLALLPTSRMSAANSAAAASGFIGIAMIVGTAVLVKGGTGFPGWVAVFPVAGALATLHAGANGPRRAVSALLSAAPLQFLGARSYSWYLWHWPFVVFAGVLFPGITFGGKVVAAIASLLAATATYHLVERPVRTNAYLGARSGLSLGIAAGATLLTVVASWTWVMVARQQLAVDAKFQAIGAATADFGKLPKDCRSEGLSSDVNVCAFGASVAPHVLVLFGDSHAMQWFDPVRTATDLEGWRLVVIVRPGCAASDIDSRRSSAIEDHCRQWRTRAIERILEMHPEAVVMASYIAATPRGDFMTGSHMTTEEVRSGTRRTLDKFARRGIPVVVMRDTPLPPFNIPACIARRVAGKLGAGESCDFDSSVALNAPAYSAEQTAADGLADIHFLDMNDLICPGKSCPATEHQVLIYRDENHLTGTYAQSLAPIVRTRLFRLLRRSQSASRASQRILGKPETLGKAVALTWARQELHHRSRRRWYALPPDLLPEAYDSGTDFLSRADRCLGWRHRVSWLHRRTDQGEYGGAAA